MKYLLILILSLLCTVSLISFHSSNGNKKENIASADSAHVHAGKNSNNWLDELLANYINHSDNELIKALPKKDIVWILDDTKNTDTAKYFVFQIGHEAFDVDNGDTCCYRFSTCGWVYVDSLTKRVYEYDVQNDRLIKWNK